jgi:hypothetical protein
MRARQKDVIEALEIAVSNEAISESDLIRAQQMILAPRTRLEAELSWLPELSPSRAGVIVGMLAANPPKEIAILLLDGLEGLSRVNLAADICRRYPGDIALVDELAKSYQDLSLDALEGSINASRTVAGFSRVDSGTLKSALAKTEQAHAEAATICFASAASPGRALSELIVGTLEPDSLRFEFLDATIRSYRAWAGSRLRQIEDAIQEEVISMKSSPDDPGILRSITAGMGLWSEWNGPVELWDQAKGLEEPRSYAICDRLRDLSLWLANEMGQHKAALEITEGLRCSFANLPSISKRLDEDAKILKGLVEHEVISGSVDALQQAIDGTSLPTLKSNLLSKGFGGSATGMARSLYEPFEAAISTTRGTEHVDVPWKMLRGVMIDLNNQEHKDASERLGIDLLTIAPGKASDEFVTILKEDLRTVRNNVRWSKLEYHLKVGQKKQALPLLQALIADQSSGEDLDQFHKLYMKLQADIVQERRKNKERIWKWVAGIVLLVVWISIKSCSSDDHESSLQSPMPTSTGQTEPATIDSQSNPTALAADRSTSSTDEGAETKPPVGVHNALSLGQLRYCQFQHVRIARAQSLSSTHDEIENVNSAVDDFNLRCSRYRYFENDMTTVKSELESKQSQIERDAQALLTGSTNQ